MLRKLISEWKEYLYQKLRPPQPKKTRDDHWREVLAEIEKIPPRPRPKHNPLDNLKKKSRRIEWL